MELTDEQYEYYEKESRALMGEYVKKLNELPDFQNSDLETQVKLRTLVENAAVRQAQKKTEDKYRNQFPAPAKEDVEKQNKEKDVQKNIKETLGIK